jgi:hypothetical protein
MRRITYIVIGAVFFYCGDVLAIAHPPVEIADSLYKLCNRSDDGSKAVCTGYIAGAFDALAENPINGITTCVPAMTKLSTIKRLTLHWIASHQDCRVKPASEAVADAIAEAFPCGNSR